MIPVILFNRNSVLGLFLNFLVTYEEKIATNKHQTVPVITKERPKIIKRSI